MTQATAQVLGHDHPFAGLDDLAALRRFAKTGDPRAFEVLVCRYQRMVFATCRRALGDAADAEDAAQDTFLKLAQHAGAVRSNAAAWLHACAMRCSIDALRRRGARDRAERRAAAEVVEPSEEGRLWREIEPRLDAALAAMDEGDRDLIVARFLSGRSQADLAREAGVNPGTIHRRLDRALGRLRKKLGASGALAPASTAVFASALALGVRSCPAPETLASGLMKVALVGPGSSGVGSFGVGSSGAGSLSFATLMSGTGAKIAAGVVGLAVLGSGAWVATQRAGGSSVGTVAASSGVLGSGAAAAGREDATLPKGRYVVSSVLIDGEPSSRLTLRGDELRVRFQTDARGARPELRFRVLSRERGKDGVTMRARLERSTFAKPDVYADLVGETITLGASVDRGFVTVEGDITVKSSWGADVPLAWTGLRPPGVEASGDPAGIDGEWHEAMRYEAEIDGGMITIRHQDFKAYAYRVLESEAGPRFDRHQAICTDSWDPSLVGKRVKLLVRDDDDGFSLAMHRAGSLDLNEYPRSFEAAGLQVMSWRKAK